MWFVPGNVILHGFCDADYAGCPDTSRSRSGYIVKVGSTAVAWIRKARGRTVLQLVLVRVSMLQH